MSARSEDINAMLTDLPHLPVSETFDAIRTALADAAEEPRNCIIVAPPGAGKTTRIPLLLIGEPWSANKRIIVLEPRRIAARGAAAHMARLLGERVGETIGLRVRFENRTSSATRIEVVTEGVFTRMILDDPELDGIAAILFDEFHERSLDADLGLALALDVQTALRPDLRLVPMSATLDGASLSAVMGDCPVVASDGRSFPVRQLYRPRKPDSRLELEMTDAIRHALATASGSILAFLPGQGEIHRTAQLLDDTLPADTDLHKLYGAMSPRDQDAAINPPAAGRKKVVLATAIAETSLTIDGVTTVIDSGLSRVPVFDAASGVTRLETRRASLATVTQRAGRAGRTAPGTVIRLWHESNNNGLAERDRPEILSADLTALALDLLSWGTDDPASLSFPDQPPSGAWRLALEQLVSIGAAETIAETQSKTGVRHHLTSLGKRIATLPLSPRLGAMVIKANRFAKAEQAARLALLLSEQGLGGKDIDLDHRLEKLLNADKSGKGNRGREQAALGLASRIARLASDMDLSSEPHERVLLGVDTLKTSSGGNLAVGMPDRIALRTGTEKRSAGSTIQTVDYLMANGKRATLDRQDPLATHEMLVVADLQGSASRPHITSAAALERAEFERLFGDRVRRERRVIFDMTRKRFVASEVVAFDSLVFSSRNVPLLPEDRNDLAIVQAIDQHGLDILSIDQATRGLIDRLAFAFRHLGDGKLSSPWPDVNMDYLSRTASSWLLPYIPGISSLDEVRPSTLRDALMGLLPTELAAKLETLLPSRFTAPTGSNITVRYDHEQAIVAIRVQELYGLDQHPMIGGAGPDAIPLTFELLSPAQRPIQKTTDLPGFWRGSWADVRTEMKGRYPKHVWPEKPQDAEPTRRAKPKGN